MHSQQEASNHHSITFPWLHPVSELSRLPLSGLTHGEGEGTIVCPWILQFCQATACSPFVDPRFATSSSSSNTLKSTDDAMSHPITRARAMIGAAIAPTDPEAT